jgi:hypothetical protein
MHPFFNYDKNLVLNTKSLGASLAARAQGNNIFLLYALITVTEGEGFSATITVLVIVEILIALELLSNLAVVHK